MNPTQNPIFTWLHKARVLMLVIAMLSLTFTGCDDDDEDGPAAPTQNIVQLAQGNSNLSSLVAALTKYPDLVATLSSTSTDFTVFAPSNDAFADLLEAIGQSSINDIPESVLRDVLEYHVIAGAAVKSTELTAGAKETVNGEDIAVTLTGGLKLNGTVNVTTADVEATNGVVHVIDAVLVPPTIVPIVGTIVAPAYFNKNFSTLVAAVVQADLLDALLDGDANYTLFAPTNAAFEAAGINELPANTTEGNAALSAILLYHVLGSEVKAADLPATTPNTPAAIETLGGDLFYLTNRGGGAGVFINGSTQVTATDIEASNGVVHVINRTLKPAAGNIAEVATAAGFTQLVAAVAKFPDLLEAVQSDASNLTVFAPTDAAFQALYTAQSVANLDALVTKLGSANVKKVLQHHIVGARVFSSDLAGGSVGTLEQNISINLTTLTITSASGGTAALVPTSLNVFASNGVIHVIDAVLIPTL